MKLSQEANFSEFKRFINFINLQRFRDPLPISYNLHPNTAAIISSRFTSSPLKERESSEPEIFVQITPYNISSLSILNLFELPPSASVRTQGTKKGVAPSATREVWTKFETGARIWANQESSISSFLSEKIVCLTVRVSTLLDFIPRRSGQRGSSLQSQHIPRRSTRWHSWKGSWMGIL